MALMKEKGSAFLEYPRESEKIGETACRFRVEISKDISNEIAGVDLFIDRAIYHRCRGALGSYWYDWSGYLPGEHRVSAMVRTRDGHNLLIGPRRFSVDFKAAAADPPRHN